VTVIKIRQCGEAVVAPLDTTRKTVIGGATINSDLSVPLLDHLSAVVHNLQNRC
jgi:hypothetical protein